MGRHYHFRPGEFYRTDDRTGFPQYASRTRKQWNNLIVDESVYEPRQPQDLVKGVKDQQSVVDARPLSPAQFVTALYYQTTESATPGQLIIYLQSTARMAIGDPVGVVMDTDGGAIFRTTIAFVGSDFIFLADPLPGYMTSGNEVVDYAPGSGVVTELLLAQENGYPLLQENGAFILVEGTI